MSVTHGFTVKSKRKIYINIVIGRGFSDGSVVKNPPAMKETGDPVSIPGMGRSPGGGNGNSLQLSYLENPMDRGAWRATVRGITKSQTQLSRSTTNTYCAI